MEEIMKYLTLLLCVIWLSACSSTTVYKTTLAETSGSVGDIRSEDIAYCMKLARPDVQTATSQVKSGTGVSSFLPYREVILLEEGLKAAKSVSETKKADSESAQDQRVKLFRTCLIEKGYSLSVETMED